MAVQWHPGWDQQMSYTWASDRWVMPAPYYTTSVVYADLGFSQPTFVLSCWVKKDALWVGTIVTLSIYLSIYLSIHPSIYLSIYIYIYSISFLTWDDDMLYPGDNFGVPSDQWLRFWRGLLLFGFQLCGRQTARGRDPIFPRGPRVMCFGSGKSHSEFAADQGVMPWICVNFPLFVEFLLSLCLDRWFFPGGSQSQHVFAQEQQALGHLCCSRWPRLSGQLPRLVRSSMGGAEGVGQPAVAKKSGHLADCRDPFPLWSWTRWGRRKVEWPKMTKDDQRWPKMKSWELKGCYMLDSTLKLPKHQTIIKYHKAKCKDYLEMFTWFTCRFLQDLGQHGIGFVDHWAPPRPRAVVPRWLRQEPHGHHLYRHWRRGWYYLWGNTRSRPHRGCQFPVDLILYLFLKFLP